MPRRVSRTVVPPLPPPSAAAIEDPAADSADAGDMDFELNHVGEDAPELNMYRDSGDLLALSNPDFQDWSWMIYRLRSSEEMIRERTKVQRIVITKLVGPLDINELQRVAGGGVFEIRGFRGGRQAITIRQELAGPIRTYAPAPSPAVGSAAPGSSENGGASSSASERRILRMLREQNANMAALISELRRSPAPTPASATAPVTSITEIFELADRLHQRTNPSPEGNVLGEVVGAFKQGFQLRTEIEGGPEKSTTEVMLEKGLPMIERLLGNFLTSRAPAPRRPAPPASSASVVEHASATPPAPPASAPPPSPPTPGDDGAHRWATAVESLARAIEDEDDPRDFSITLSAILRANELALIQGAPPAIVTAQLRQRAGGEFPVLLEDRTEAFIAQVVHALNHPDEDDDDEASE